MKRKLLIWFLLTATVFAQHTTTPNLGLVTGWGDGLDTNFNLLDTLMGSGGTFAGVTHTTGALTLNQLLLGNGTGDVKPLGSLGTITTVLHGNASGIPSFGSVVEGDQSLSNVTTGNVSTTRHGYAPILPNDAAKYLDGQGNYTTPPSGTGTVTSVSTGNLSPLFTASVATATTTPALSFALSNAAAHSYFGNNTGSAAAPAFNVVAYAELSGTPTLPVNTTATTSNFFTAYNSSTGAFTKAQPAYSDISGTPQLAQTLANASHKWLNSYDAVTGLFTQTQPAYSDISSTPQLAQSLTTVSHKWLDSYDAVTGLFIQTQPAYSDISGTPTLATVATSGAYSDLTGTPTLPANTTATTHQFFTAYNSTTGAFTKAQPAESDLSFTDITTNNATSSLHGFLKKLSGSATDFMNGAGNWAVPAGGVTSIATTSPITGGTITSTGTIACPTCPTVGPNLTLVGGIIGIGASAGISSQNNIPWFSDASNPNAGFAIMPFEGWLRNFTFQTTTANGAGSLWQSYLGLDIGGGAIADTQFFNMGSSLAAGAYQSSNMAPRYLSVETPFYQILKGRTPTGSTMSVIRGVTAEIIGSTSSILGTYVGGTVALSTTIYTSPSQKQGLNSNATEGLAGVVVPYASTAKNLCVWLSTAQSGTGSLVVTLRQNGTTSTSLVVTMAASAGVGPYCDPTHTVSLSANDWITFQVINNATATSGSILGITMELVPSGSATGMIVFGLGGQTVASGAARYWSPFGGGAVTTTIANAQVALPRALTMKNLNCYVTTAPGTAAVAATIYKNGVATALTVSIGTGFSAPGIAADTADSVSFAALDNLELLTNQSSGSNPAISSCSVEID